MAITRFADGTSRPRTFPEFNATAPTKTRVSKKNPSTTSKVKKAASDVTKKAKATAGKAKKQTEKKVVGTKANTSKPRVKKQTKEKESANEKVAKGRVEKQTPKKKETAVTKRDTTLLEKAEGAAEYLLGTLKPGKKVCFQIHLDDNAAVFCNWAQVLY